MLGSYAQSPQALQYQAIARDTEGNVLANQDVSFKIVIVRNNTNGPVVYREVHDTITNELGLVNLEIGNGTVLFGAFEEIQWGEASHFLRLLMDKNGGSNYQFIGTSQLLSVPYSLYSASTGDTTRWRKNMNNDLYYNSGNIGIGVEEPEWFAKLDVDGNVNVRGRAIVSRTDETESVINMWNTVSDWEIVAATDANRFMIREWEGEPVFNITDAKVGIGTTSPEYDLDIYSNSTAASRMRLATLDYSKSIFFSSGNENFDPSIYFQGGDALRFMRYDGGYNELMRITSDGKIGVGITDPFYNLEIMSTATDLTSKIRLANLDDSKDLRLSSGSDLHDPHISFAGADALRFMRWEGAYNELMRITSDGKIGIGTESPETALHIKGSGWPTAFLALQSSDNNDAGIRLYEGEIANWHILNDGVKDGLVIRNQEFTKVVFYADQEEANVGIGTDDPEESALLELNSDSKGFLFPRLTLAAIQAIENPAAGLTVFNTDDNRFYFYDEGVNNWKEIAIGAGTIYSGCGTATDGDGNAYNTIKIGTQCWLKENLVTTKYNDETDIPLVTDNTAWENLLTPGYCWYDNDQATYGNTYGALYNWHTVNTGELCPIGWHVPSDDEWDVLVAYLGDVSEAGGKLKETGTTHWNTPNTGATNETGFTSLPGSYRSSGGNFDSSIGKKGLWWSATGYASYGAFHRWMFHDASNVGRSGNYREMGQSVRCLRD